MNRQAAAWLAGDDTGSSSRTILYFMESIEAYRVEWPRDPADFGRCLRLLDAVPEYRQRLHEMARLSPEWRSLIDHWAELESLYRKEYPTGRAPQLYDRMMQLTQPVWYEKLKAER